MRRRIFDIILNVIRLMTFQPGLSEGAGRSDDGDSTHRSP